MPLKASVYVTEDPENLYKARITFSLESCRGVKPMDLSCTLTRGRHDLRVYANSRELHPDTETRELIEALVLVGARKIATVQVDIVKEQCGRHICTGTDDESGIYANRQYPGQIETQIAEVPRYVSRVIELANRKARS